MRLLSDVGISLDGCNADCHGERAESLVVDLSENESEFSSDTDDENISSSSDDSLIRPAGLTSSGRRRLSSSESVFSENSDTGIDPVDADGEGWEEVFENTDNPSEAHYEFEELPGPNHAHIKSARGILCMYCVDGPGTKRVKLSNFSFF